MLFNSYEFIFMFLPVSLAIYFILNRYRMNMALIWLTVCSLFFYSWWNIKNLPILLGSICFNYAAGYLLNKKENENRRLYLMIGVIFNIALLGYYKYVDFFISNINLATNTKLPMLNIILPLGISFFTFTQIAYLVDSYRNTAREYNFINYVLFVTFFPHLIAGPILHHKEMMPQFASEKNKSLNWENVSKGLGYFAIGLFKKVIIADSLVLWASPGFKAASLTMVEAWATAISYTLQLYFDFSGYTDMAIGIALMFNIVLPQNFDSPYKSASVIEFWRRWHMTLSRFLRDYLYISLGGNRKGKVRRYINLFLTMLIGGLWHGAAWTFVVWGALHGAALVVNHLWRSMGLKMHWLAGRVLTFGFITMTWVVFRAENFRQAFVVLRGMINVKHTGILTAGITQALPYGRIELAVLFILFLFVSAARNSSELVIKLKPNWIWAVGVSMLLVAGILGLNRISEFLYFQF